LSITFINEIARVCEIVGADAKEVSTGLKSEPRIGPKAYLSPGGPFAGGTLARDVVTLTELAAGHNEPLSLIPAIKQSNEVHAWWSFNRLKARFGGELDGKVIAVLGLTYTPNTDTLRRSAAVELIRRLSTAGAFVKAFDPAVKELPSEFDKVRLAGSIIEALEGSDAAVVCTEWPQFREPDWTSLVPLMRLPLFVDANRFLEKELKKIPGVVHLSVGSA